MKTGFTLLLMLLFGALSRAQIIRTVAGNGSDSCNGVGTVAIESSLCAPMKVAADVLGNVYIADANRIRKVNPLGVITTIAGTDTAGSNGLGNGAPATNVEINVSAGLAVDASGTVYFSDLGNYCVRRINVDGTLTTIAGGTGFGYTGDGGSATLATFMGPTGVVTDDSGQVFIADTYNNCIRKINSSGIISTIAGTGVGGYNGDNIQATVAQLRFPRGLALDSYGNLYIADGGNARIRKIDTSGLITTIAGVEIAGYNGDGIAATAAQLNSPYDVGVDANGNVYVADMFNYRVRRIDAAGIISTVAGTGADGFSGDNEPATTAEIAKPTGIAVIGPGDFYIADVYNYRIRFVGPPLSAPSPLIQPSIVTVHPNPSMGAFTINVSTDVSENVRINVLDALGNSVFETDAKTNKDVPIALRLAAGVYFLSAVSEHNAGTVRLAIQ